LEGLRDRRPGRPHKNRTKAELARLRAENDKLRDELDTAKELIEAQGKVSALLQAMSPKSAATNTNKR
jgi:hypothetical protein